MNLTQIILISVVVGLIVYNIPAVPKESQVLRDWGRRYNALPFCGGFLLGHWWVNHNNLWRSGWMLALPIILGLVGWDYYWNSKPRDWKWYRYSGLWAVVGILVGTLMWAQHL